MMKKFACIYNCSFFLSLVWLFVSTLLLLTAGNTVVANKDADTKKQPYIVYMGERKHHDVEQITKSHHEMLASVLGSKEAAVDSIIYSYRHGFSGFAAKMTGSQAKYFQGLPGVVRVFPNQLYKLQTTRSWDYLGLSNSSTTNLLQDTNQGDGAIIGVIDSGIWPESPSFDDKGLGPIPSKWKGYCESGDKFNPKKHCNKKLIGARYFIQGLKASLDEPFNATETKDYISPRDSDNHGTHCASTAGGSFVSGLAFNGVPQPPARGGAPRARIAAYKVSWASGSLASSVDVLKAFDEAIHDGVDVLSLSIGLDLPLAPETDKGDLIYYGSFHAVARGIIVVCSAGNSGPVAETVEDVAPWVISVGASTIDRTIANPIILGNNHVIEGHGMYTGRDTGFVDLVYYKERKDAETQASCEELTANDTWVAGKVVLCFTEVRDDVDPIGDIAEKVALAGGLGVIVTKKVVPSSSSYQSSFPLFLVSYQVGTQILNYIHSTKNAKVRLKPAQIYVGIKATTYITSFSSRGPNSLSPTVLKPDIAAPGVDILAAIVPSKQNLIGYDFMSGTSMACPHIAGVSALLKSLHPHWSPAAIRSAIVTTAWTKDPHTGEPIYAMGEINRIADPFDYGGGVVNPNGAKNPGLVYDIETRHYTNYLCAMGYAETDINQLTGQAKSCLKSTKSVFDLNLPSITVPKLNKSITITRTVTNVGDPNSKYQVVVVPPQGIIVKVNPTYLAFNPKIKNLSFTVTITTQHKTNTEYYFGSLIWTDKVHVVKIPISVKTEFALDLAVN